MTLLIGVVLLVVAVLWSLRLRRADVVAQLRATATAQNELERAGFTPSGDPLGVFKLQGSMHGGEVTFENGTPIRPPGARDGEGAYEHPRRDAILGMWAVWTAAILLTAIGWTPLGMIAPLTVLDDKLVCAADDRMIVYDSFDEHGIRCANHPRKSLALHHAGTVTLMIATIAIVGLGIVTVRRSRAAGAAPAGGKLTHDGILQVVERP
jgi:hypothetical protein